MYISKIVARDLSDAFFQCVEETLKYGRIYKIDSGSYEGQKRWELDYIIVQIRFPGTRPLVPEMPLHLQHIPPPTTMEYVESYLPYLITAERKKNEVYTYGERIEGQMKEIVERYRNSGIGTNQCTISVSQPSDIYMKDPPCLRSIDTRIFKDDQRLHFFVYFRSWDLWNGFPANLAAIRLMQEYMAGCIGVEAGEIIASSKGLHLYDHVWDIAKLRVDYK